jgi:hypothetical protein
MHVYLRLRLLTDPPGDENPVEVSVHDFVVTCSILEPWKGALVPRY